MIECIVLNRRIRKSIVLVHGLFANAGFWLPYIHHFPRHRLLLLNINYENISDTELYNEAITEKLQPFSQGTHDAIIVHSMGAIIGRSINKESRKCYFEICPVTISKRTDINSFIDEIKIKTGQTRSEIERQLMEAKAAIENFAGDAHGDEEIHIPTNDKYFRYSTSKICCKYDGDHFNIEEAVRNIAKRMYS